MEVGFQVQQVIDRLHDRATSSQELGQEWHAVASKLQAWAATLGIINGQRSSSRKLPQRLDMSSHLSKGVETLLSGILELLSDNPGDDVILDEAQTESETKSSPGTLVRASSASDYFNEGTGILLERRSLDMAHECVNNLNGMVPALTNPAPHDAITDSRYTRIPLSQEMDVNHLQEKHPNAPLQLRQRLGRLNWQRRILRECARMQQATAQPGGESISMRPQQRAAAPVAPPSVLAVESVAQPQTTFSTQPSTLPISSHSVFDTPIRDNDSLSSVGSMSSYAATVRPRDDNHIPIPPPPAGCVEGLPFDCDICYRRVTSVKGQRRWKRHVIRDLRPYVCTYEGCRTQDATYASRKEWFEQEMTTHCVHYVCVPPCREAFETLFEFYRHLKQVHSQSLSDKQIEAMAGMRKATMFPTNGMLCPLCQAHCSSSKQLEKHLGGDLEQIALFTLPPTEDSGNIDNDHDSDGNDDDSSDGLSLVSSKEMNVEEKMELLGQSTHSMDPDDSPESGPEIEPEHVTLGLPYCRRNGQPKVDWSLRRFDKEHPFECTSFCGQRFGTKAKWKAHEELNFPRAWWICKFCSDMFPRRDRLRDHKKKEHGQTKIEPTEKREANQDTQSLLPCFFDCGYGETGFDDWIDHVGRHFAVDIKNCEFSADPRVLDVGPLDVLGLLKRITKRDSLLNNDSAGQPPTILQDTSQHAGASSQADRVESKVQSTAERDVSLSSGGGPSPPGEKDLPMQLGSFNSRHNASSKAREYGSGSQAARLQTSPASYADVVAERRLLEGNDGTRPQHSNISPANYFLDKSPETNSRSNLGSYQNNEGYPPLKSKEAFDSITPKTSSAVNHTTRAMREAPLPLRTAATMLQPHDNIVDIEEEDWCVEQPHLRKTTLTLSASPLCLEEFDLSDKHFRPCPCGYQVSWRIT